VSTAPQAARAATRGRVRRVPPRRLAAVAAVWLAVTFDSVGERWIIGGSLWLARTTVATVARATALAQSGIVRQYVTVLAGGAALVAVFFLGKANL